MTGTFERIKAKLGGKPKTLNDTKEWLFVAVNTARAMIDNADKADLAAAERFAECRTVSELQRNFDAVQGIYGRERFSYRNSPEYRYLCSLTAFFPEKELSDDDRRYIMQICGYDRYLLYEI